MFRAFLLGLAVLPVQVQALSCLPWHVEDAFQEADASRDPYVIVTGTLDVAAEDLPQVDWERQEDVPPETQAGGRFAGTVLGRSGASAPFDEAVSLIVECAGPWCPQIEPGAQYLAFVDTSETPHALRIGACGGMLFLNPPAEMLDRVRQCLAGADCTPPER